MFIGNWVTQFLINVIHISPNNIATLLSAFGKKDQVGNVQQRDDEGGEEDKENSPPDSAPPSQDVSKLKTFFRGYQCPSIYCRQ